MKQHCLLLVCAALGMSACGQTNDQPIDQPIDQPDPDNPSGTMVLDYTAYIEGAIQVSGVGVSQSDGTIALVTDFESLMLIDPETVSEIGSFSVQLGNLPEQGSSEAVSFTSSGDLAVLYPEHKRVISYDPTGSDRVADLDLSAIVEPIHGSMTIAPDTDTIYMIAGEGPFELIGVSYPDGSVTTRATLTGDLAAEVTGLSLAVDGSATELWAVSEDNRAFDLNVATGALTLQATLSEVGESSGAEAFLNPEGENVLAVSDDSDEYNAEPGPLRLYLLD